MARNKFDGILAAVRVNEDGGLVIARIFERHGVIFTDHFLVDRDNLIKRIKGGQKFLTGKRQYKMGSRFETAEVVHVVSSQGNDYLVVGAEDADRDQLQPVPRF